MTVDSILYFVSLFVGIYHILIGISATLLFPFIPIHVPDKISRLQEIGLEWKESEGSKLKSVFRIVFVSLTLNKQSLFLILRYNSNVPEITPNKMYKYQKVV